MHCGFLNSNKAVSKVLHSGTLKKSLYKNVPVIFIRTTILPVLLLLLLLNSKVFKYLSK